jgi:hypothetical protein
VERTADLWNQTARVQRFDMAADRPAGWVVPLLIGKPLSAERQSRIRCSLITALTHPVTEVRWFAAWGVGKNLWAIDRNLALRCVNALALEATQLRRAVEAERERLLKEQDFNRYHAGEWFDRVAGTIAADIRRRFLGGGEIPDDAIQALDGSEWYGAEASGRILAILDEVPGEPAAVTGFTQLARTLVGWWDADDEGHRSPHEGRRQRHYESESALAELLESFLMRAPGAVSATILQPILEAVDRHPKQIERIVQGLVFAEDRRPNTPQFWYLWSLFADRVLQATWLPDLDGEYAEGRQMVSAIFLGPWWKEHVRHWRSLDGYANRVHGLFEDLPASSTVLEHYVRFLHHVGEQSLPEAFIRIMKRLQRGDPRQMLRKGNTVFLLELLLQRYVYGRPLELKRQNDLRNAVLGLLDVLVENGSSAAFRMRDDFVTPLPMV